MKIKKILATLGVAGAVAGGLALAAPAANAEGCAYGNGGWGGGGFCDGDYWPDGSYNHCVSVYVMGFGGASCNRIYPPAP